MNYKGHSEFQHLLDHGLTEIRTSIDDLKDIGIKRGVLKKAYAVLSATGSATEQEKLEIHKNLLRTHKKLTTHREVLLDDLYSWKKVYRERVVDFNMFIHEYLGYIDRECGAGNAKSGFVSFNRGNKILEGYVRWFIDTYNIYLFPTKSRIEKINKSKIVVDRS